MHVCYAYTHTSVIHTYMWVYIYIHIVYTHTHKVNDSNVEGKGGKTVLLLQGIHTSHQLVQHYTEVCIVVYCYLKVD